MAPLAMVEHLVGMQAQNPLDPYVALWSRLATFQPGELAAAVTDRRAVRMGLLRTTLHLVSADDALAMYPVIRPVLARAWKSSPFIKQLPEADMDAILDESRRRLEGGALTSSDLGKQLHEVWPQYAANPLAYAARFLLPIVQVPPRGVWGKTGRPSWTTLEAWLGRPLTATSTPDAWVLRYLAAFGPASVADIRIWSWSTSLREVVDRLRPQLVTFRDESGRELFDLPDAPRPDPDYARAAPVPARIRQRRPLARRPLADHRRQRLWATDRLGRHVHHRWVHPRPVADRPGQASGNADPPAVRTAISRRTTDELVAEAEGCCGSTRRQSRTGAWSSGRPRAGTRGIPQHWRHRAAPAAGGATRTGSIDDLPHLPLERRRGVGRQRAIDSDDRPVHVYDPDADGFANVSGQRPSDGRFGVPEREVALYSRRPNRILIETTFAGCPPMVTSDGPSTRSVPGIDETAAARPAGVSPAADPTVPGCRDPRKHWSAGWSRR